MGTIKDERESPWANWNYLERQASALVLCMHKTSADRSRGSALWWERCNDAVQSPWQRMAAQSELHERGDLGSQTSSPATSVRLLYVYCALIAFISRSYCAVTVLLRRFMGQLPLILRPHCAATKTMTLVIRSRRCSDVCNRFSMRSYCDHTYTDPPPPSPRYNTASSSAHNQCAPVIFSMAVERQNLLIVQQLAHMQAQDDQVLVNIMRRRRRRRRRRERRCWYDHGHATFRPIFLIPCMAQGLHVDGFPQVAVGAI